MKKNRLETNLACALILGLAPAAWAQGGSNGKGNGGGGEGGARVSPGNASGRGGQGVALRGAAIYK